MAGRIKSFPPAQGDWASAGRVMFYDQSTPSVGAAGGGASPALSVNVLVLNKFYQAIRVVNVRRAFSLLCRELAEVVHIETDSRGQSRWQNFNFDGWRELSELKAEFEPDGFDWIHTV